MASRPSSGFVGRQGELRQLRAYVDEARNGTGRAVIISGEAGIGKTRLCEELASVARDADVGVASTACWESGGFPPFWPWRQLLEQVGGELGQTSTDEEEPDVARARLFATAIDAVRAAARVRPWLLVFDDVHWADAGTLRLLAHIAPLVRSMRVVLVAAWRDGEHASPSLPADLRRHARWVRLEGLIADEVGELVADLTGSRAS